MFIRLMFSQMVAKKLVEDQVIDYSGIIAVICEIIRRSCGFVSGRMSERGNQISILVATNFKLTVFMFKMMEHCYKQYDIGNVGKRSVLKFHINESWKKDTQPQSAQCRQEKFGKIHGSNHSSY